MSIFVRCPWCDLWVEIVQINCGIFRHGIFIENGQQLDPHSPKEYCEKVFTDKLIYGCGKPFKLEVPEYNAIKCDYI